MADDMDLVRTAYEQCGAAYNTAVEVSKYTWTAFYTRTAALLGAAGYIVFEHPGAAWLAAVLLVIGAWATWYISRVQMNTNQNVIRKVIAAGLLLERDNKGLGCRYTLDAWGDELKEQKTLDELRDGPPGIGTRHLLNLGLTPQFSQLCAIYALIQLAFSAVAFGWWIVFLLWPSVIVATATLTTCQCSRPCLP